MARNVADGRRSRPRVEGFLGIRRVPREFTKNGMQERMQDMMQETLQERMQEFIDVNTLAGARTAGEVARAEPASRAPAATCGGQPVNLGEEFRAGRMVVASHGSFRAGRRS
jgi:hypothetical protein